MGLRLVLATHNVHKVEEFRRILAPAVPGLELEGYDGPEPVEDGVTFEENALLKARAAARHTGLASLADDSGLAVDVLGGAPGVFSARWSGRHGDDEANLRLLLAQVADVPARHRSAAFVCVLALCLPDGREETVAGRWEGSLATAPAGGGGFGYDPVFVPAGATVTAAELDPAEKDAASHRGRAFVALVPRLRDLAAGD